MEHSQQEDMLSKILQADAKYPIVAKKIAYGTAGFRTVADNLDRVCFRTGIFAAIRSKITGLAGVMITASHNPKQDNGLKIIERDGAMLNMAWEKLVEGLT
jgi:phosphoacetylglucosamine mutase